MYEEHPNFTPPEPSDYLWRYVDFTTFLSLLDRQALFFARADRLSDHWEGAMPTPNYLLRKTMFGGVVPEKHLDQFRGLPSRISESMRRHTYVNCWHQNSGESAAMWRLYLQSDQGIAIRTTFERMKQSLSIEKRSIYVGRVAYIDYHRTLIGDGNTFAPFLHKRSSFEHEREVRAVLQPLPESPMDIFDGPSAADYGIEVSVDVDLLIEMVFIAPTAADWFRDLVESASKRFGFKGSICQSGLSADPRF